MTSVIFTRASMKSEALDPLHRHEIRLKSCMSYKKKIKPFCGFRSKRAGWGSDEERGKDLGLFSARIFWFLGIYGYLWVAWVSIGIIFKHWKYFLFYHSRTPEDLKISKNVWNHSCVMKNSVCTTEERDFIDSCIFSIHQ